MNKYFRKKIKLAKIVRLDSKLWHPLILLPATVSEEEDKSSSLAQLFMEGLSDAQLSASSISESQSRNPQPPSLANFKLTLTADISSPTTIS